MTISIKKGDSLIASLYTVKYARSAWTNLQTIEIEEIVVEFVRVVFATAFVIEVFVILFTLLMKYIGNVKGIPLMVSIHFGYANWREVFKVFATQVMM